MERVTQLTGKTPVILVAPHGADDTNTDLIAEYAAKQLNCYAVINRGFERADSVDVDKDKADCNRIDHVKQPVVYDEFLRPIQRFETKLVKGSNQSYTGAIGWYNYTPEPVHIFHIHGCGNMVHTEANEAVEVIIGYGLGQKKHSHSCEVWRKNCFVDLYRKYGAASGDVFEARGGGKYAGRDSNNMNQYFRKHSPKSWVQSMQLEYPFSLRDSDAGAITTAMALAVVIGEYIQYKSYDLEPVAKFI